MARVAYTTETQGVLSAAETIDTISAATLRNLTPCSYDCDRIAFNCVVAPGIALPVVIEINVESAVALQHPDCPERVCPAAGNRLRPGARVCGASTQAR